MNPNINQDVDIKFRSEYGTVDATVRDVYAPLADYPLAKFSLDDMMGSDNEEWRQAIRKYVIPKRRGSI